MSPYRRNVLVGITVLGAMAILGWMILQFGGRVIGPFTTAKMRLVLVSDRADGISDGSAVVYHGVNVGQITEVRLDPDQQHVHIFADVLTNPPLPANLMATIKTSGLIGTGAQLVLDTPPGEAPKGTLSRNQEISARFVGLADFIPPEFGKLAEDLRKTSQQFRESHIMEDLDAQIQHAGRMMDSMQGVIDDPKMRKDLSDSIANMRLATETIN